VLPAKSHPDGGLADENRKSLPSPERTSITVRFVCWMIP
jgi:hypothetical protein